MTSRSNVAHPGLTPAMVTNASVPGIAHADVAEAIRDAFAVENMAAVDQFLLELFEFARIKTGNIGISHEDSSNQVSQSRFYGATIALSRRVSLTIGALEG